MDAEAEAHGRRLSAHIRDAITAYGGRLPFDRFMELALYAPGLGYYVAGAAKLGAAGDFVTAPEVSPLFGRCLAQPCARVLAALGGGDVLEFGAGSGALAAELLGALAARGLTPRRYLILEPSPELAERQRVTLRNRVPELFDRVHWLDRLPAGLRGVVIANEVLDALPVHRFCIGAGGTVEEVFVEVRNDGFGMATAAPVSTGLADAVHRLQAVGLATAPGYCSEINLRAGPWVRALADSLDAGLALLIDYGYPRAEYYLPERSDGTLMCHHRHQAHSNPFVNVGLQDITAHVDFSAVAEAAAAAGLTLAGYTTQARFLVDCGIDRHMAEAAAGEPAAMLDLAAGAKQLLLPALMGERFQVLGLARDLPEQGIVGFRQPDLRHRL
jgi:SAM-dependent MidA family methyltransferase